MTFEENKQVSKEKMDIEMGKKEKIHFSLKKFPIKKHKKKRSTRS